MRKRHAATPSCSLFFASHFDQIILKKINKKSTAPAQSKKGKYSTRLSNSLELGHHESFRTDDSFYRLLIESLSGYGIFTTDKKGNISSWNLGAEKLFGYSENEIIGQNASIIFRKEDIEKIQIKQKLESATLKTKVIIEQFYVRKDGSKFWASGLIFSLGDNADIARGFTFIVRDLTEKMEFAKRQDSFISTATHELKTPIASMKLYAQIVEREVKKSKNKINIKSVGELHKQLDKITSLMDYLLDVSKIQKGKIELEKTTFDMNILVEEIVATIQVVSKEHIIVRKGKVSAEVYGDRDRIGQVLTNLITNAIKYSPHSKKAIIISIDNKINIIISIQDFGIGIPKAEQNDIFGRFYRAVSILDLKIEGIGLGLYVAQQIVEAHKGKMWLESEVGKGSTFYFSLPREAKV
jgi:PAS domain S-box-containing protein